MSKPRRKIVNSSDSRIVGDTSILGKRIYLFYPPGPMYQRGEDRSQGNISQSAATVMRAPNDMGYAASTLLEMGCDVKFSDFQTEMKSELDMINALEDFQPDALLMSITNSTVVHDLKLLGRVKKIWPSMVIVVKGALFWDAPGDVISQLNLIDIDYLIGGEIEFSAAKLLKTHFEKRHHDLKEVPGIAYRQGSGWKKTKFGFFEKDFDDLPHPARHLINNNLYVRPDTGEAQATIVTSRGCPAACTYCLTPIISGKMTRFRSPDSILRELKECYWKFGIKNFFFKSDTFTINRNWVKSVCEKINESELKGKISWVANSRVRPLAEDTLKLMQAAGCWLVAFGFESGSEESLKLMKKGAKVSDNLRAAKLAKEAGLKVYGFFLIGMPWENNEHLLDTKQHIFDLDADFIEVHIAVPYYGTELYKQAEKANVLDDTVIGKDYFNSPTIGTEFLDISEVERIRKRILLLYHVRPKYIFKKLYGSIGSPKVLFNYARFGIRLIKGLST